MAINENALAKSVAGEEGGKVNLPIAQIKEVQSKLLDKLATEKVSDVVALLEKHRAKIDAASSEAGG
jgi:hypothetical protein